MNTQTIDTLFENGVFHTCVSADEQYKYLGVRGGKICYLANEPLQSVKIKRRVDLCGKHVYPALTDAHLHLMFSIVQSASNAQICTITDNGVTPNTMASVEKRVRAIASGAKKGQIISATNYIVSAIDEARLPTRDELDAWTDGAPVVVYSIDGHSAALSSKMLEKVGLDPKSHSGVLSGWEHESMQGRITDTIASGVGVGVLARGIANFTNLCAEYGIARVCALDGAAGVTKDPLMKLLVFIARRLPLEVRLFPEYMDLERVKPLLKYMRRPRVGGCGEWEMDGSVGSHSAAFSTPYLDGESADCYYDKETVANTVQQAHRAGWQVSSHAIGERAIALIQSVFEALPDNGGGVPHRIDHYEFPHPADAARLPHSNIAITVQPGYSWVDKCYLKSYEHFLRPETITGQLPLASLVRAGVTVCGSSDSPVQSIDPYAQMLGMVDFYLPEQSLTPYEAFTSYCIAPAVMLGEQAEFGTLEAGKRADFFTTNADIFHLTAREIPAVRADALYVEGKRFKKRKGTVLECIGMLFHRTKPL